MVNTMKTENLLTLVFYMIYLADQAHDWQHVLVYQSWRGLRTLYLSNKLFQHLGACYINHRTISTIVELPWSKL